AFDRKMLLLLQEDARLTNNDLSQRVNLSPSQCSRRRQRLEDDGLIRGYRAILDRDRLGFSLVSVISVTLATHNRDNARRFAELVSRLPEVQEAQRTDYDEDELDNQDPHGKHAGRTLDAPPEDLNSEARVSDDIKPGTRRRLEEADLSVDGPPSRDQEG
ncbi:MAG: Lrp/AsnC family transcriptional regulator, partial [Gemmatimonadota bacterium]